MVEQSCKSVGARGFGRIQIKQSCFNFILGKWEREAVVSLEAHQRVDMLGDLLNILYCGIASREKASIEVDDNLLNLFLTSGYIAELILKRDEDMI